MLALDMGQGTFAQGHCSISTWAEPCPAFWFPSKEELHPVAEVNTGLNLNVRHLGELVILTVRLLLEHRVGMELVTESSEWLGSAAAVLVAGPEQ